MMIRLSVDIMWSIRLLLNRVEAYKLLNVNDIYLSNITSVNTDMLINLAETCEWIKKTDDLTIVLSDRGNEIVHSKDFKIQAEKILADYIIKIMPCWAKRIPYGRREAFIFMSKDEQACFFEAGLMNSVPDMNIIAWWDKIANHIRSQKDICKNNIGRLGECTTIWYEKRRTGIEPEWISIDTNLSGYDIISQNTSNDTSKLIIEVKSSELDIRSADFYITSNEWHVANNTKNYTIYLWCFANSQKKLAILEPKQLLPYIPTNNETGEWQTVKIPYVSFEMFFSEII